MTRTRQWAVFTALGCAAVLVVGWMLVVRPQHSHASSLRAQAASAQQTNQQVQTQIAQLRQQEKGLPAQQAKLAKAAQLIPDNPALPALIRQLSAAADGAGVTLVSLAPSTPTMVQSSAAGAAPAAGAAAPASGAAAPAAGGSPLAAIPVTIQVQGSYYNLIQFFSAVENLSRAVLVNGFSESLASGGSGGSSGSAPPAAGSAPSAGGAGALPPGTLSAQLNATVFMSPQVAMATTVK